MNDGETRTPRQDPWEQLRHLTLDQIVTAVKLNGSAAVVMGRTTPEGWPFRIIVAVGSPGNELAVSFADEFNAKIGALAAFTARADRKGA